MSVAQTILSQLGGKRFSLMTGAKYFMADGNALNFQVPRVGQVRIELSADDTYQIKIGKLASLKQRLAGAPLVSWKKSVEGIYNDQLEDMFTSMTGLYTRL